MTEFALLAVFSIRIVGSLEIRTSIDSDRCIVRTGIQTGWLSRGRETTLITHHRFLMGDWRNEFRTGKKVESAGRSFLLTQQIHLNGTIGTLVCAATAADAVV